MDWILKKPSHSETRHLNISCLKRGETSVRPKLEKSQTPMSLHQQGEVDSCSLLWSRHYSCLCLCLCLHVPRALAFILTCPLHWVSYPVLMLWAIPHSTELAEPTCLASAQHSGVTLLPLRCLFLTNQCCRHVFTPTLSHIQLKIFFIDSLYFPVSLRINVSMMKIFRDTSPHGLQNWRDLKTVPPPLGDDCDVQQAPALNLFLWIQIWLFILDFLELRLVWKMFTIPYIKLVHAWT